MATAMASENGSIFKRSSQKTVNMEKSGPAKDHMSPGWQGGVSTQFLDNFKKDFEIKIQKLDKEEMVFDMVGIDPAIANAFRRILIAEVPTMAIERVFIWENSSIIQDEVLAHRLGLIPIKADPRKFQELDDPDDEKSLTEDNTLVFKLKVKCEKKTDEEMAADLAASGGKEVTKYKHESVYSRDLKWFPNGDQDQVFVGDDIVKPVMDDILIANLRPGQAIDLEIMCFKGKGQDHAKFSPVATASYRQHPKVTIVDPVVGSKAEALLQKCPMNVFDIEDIEGVATAKVARPRQCTMCRECIREKDWDSHVRLQREDDHFIFSIESVGMLPPEVLFKEAIQVLKQKCENVNSALEEDD